MAEHRYYWLKLQEDFFSSKRIKKLRRIAGGDTYTIIYLKLLILANKTGGYLYYEGVGEDFVDELSLSIDENKNDIYNTILFLEENELLRHVDDSCVRVYRPKEPRNRGSSDYTNWRTTVFQRDRFTCQNCGKRGGRINAHHIKPWAAYAELRYDVNNGITLCEKCHKELHKTYGGDISG